MILRSGLLDYLEEKYSPECIVLFGSTAKGMDDKESDIDIFIMSPSKKNISIERFEKILKKEIQLFIFDRQEFLKQKDLANNIVNGIVLRGHLEVF